LSGHGKKLPDGVYVPAELRQLRAEVYIEAGQHQEWLRSDLIDEVGQFGAGHRQAKSIVVRARR
jgi:hypothetical protein